MFLNVRKIEKITINKFSWLQNIINCVFGILLKTISHFRNENRQDYLRKQWRLITSFTTLTVSEYSELRPNLKLRTINGTTTKSLTFWCLEIYLMLDAASSLTLSTHPQFLNYYNCWQILTFLLLHSISLRILVNVTHPFMVERNINTVFTLDFSLISINISFRYFNFCKLIYRRYKKIRNEILFYQ